MWHTLDSDPHFVPKIGVVEMENDSDSAAGLQSAKLKEIRKLHLRMGGQAVGSYGRVRGTSLCCTTPNIMDQRIQTGCGDVRISGKIPIAVEEGMRVASFFCAGAQVVD